MGFSAGLLPAKTSVVHAAAIGGFQKIHRDLPNEFTLVSKLSNGKEVTLRSYSGQYLNRHRGNQVALHYRQNALGHQIAGVNDSSQNLTISTSHFPHGYLGAIKTLL